MTMGKEKSALWAVLWTQGIIYQHSNPIAIISLSKTQWGTQRIDLLQKSLQFPFLSFWFISHYAQSENVEIKCIKKTFINRSVNRRSQEGPRREIQGPLVLSKISTSGASALFLNINLWAPCSLPKYQPPLYIALARLGNLVLEEGWNILIS